VPTHRESSIRPAAVAFVAGAALTTISAAAVQLVVIPASDVSDEMWSYPWTSGALVAVSLLYAVFHLLIAIGLVGFGRSGVAGRSQMARVGVATAVVGTALLLVAELASIPIRDVAMDDTAAGVVGALFGLGTLLSAVGLLIAGKATLSASLWEGWRRYTPLGAGIVTSALVVVAVTFTNALAGGVALYGLSLLTMALALYTRPLPKPAVWTGAPA